MEDDVKRGVSGGFGSMKNLVRRRLYRFFFGGEHWCRVEMNRHIRAQLATLDKASLDAVEVSGWGRRSSGWPPFDQLNYPEFDLCRSSAERQYDVVLCEQVLEHVVDPVGAVKTL